MPKSAERSIAVIMPSRLETGPDGSLFVARAVAAARAQALPRNMRLAFYIGIDADAEIPCGFERQTDVHFIHSRGLRQAGAINAAAAAAAPLHDFIAFLEDDDRWEPHFLAWALSFLATCDFVSSNQLELDPDERCIRVNDFPTPSGWIMRMDTWRKVGPFDEHFHWHLDNDWLGRLAVSGAKRIHLVEATAPVTLESAAQVRPWIANVLTQGGSRSAVRRHLASRPLVRRLVHPGSGMYRIATDPGAAAESQNEYQQLIARFGRIPW